MRICSDSTLYLFDNYLLTKEIKDNQSTVLLSLENGKKTKSRTFHYEFKDKTGSKWFYIKTVSQTFDPSLKILDAEWCY